MNPHEQQPPADAQAARATMSAWADAQADAGEAASALWATDAEARRAWHAYQLIGDVLRSDQLAGPPDRDEALLNRVRERLALEPAIVAPTAVAAPPVAAVRSVRRWSMGAVAAGFVMVAGVAGLMQRGVEDVPIAARSTAPSQAVAARAAPEASPARLARVSQAERSTAGPASMSAAASGTGAAAAAAADPQWRMLDGQVIRDARLDAYLRAHRGTGSASGRFETVVLDR